jgi:uncharacterized protein YuzE
MAGQNGNTGYELSLTLDSSGQVEAAYLRLGPGKVSRTREIEPDVLLADFNSRGMLVGIEVLAPVRLVDLTRLITQSRRTVVRRVFRQAAPQLLAG